MPTKVGIYQSAVPRWLPTLVGNYLTLPLVGHTVRHLTGSHMLARTVDVVL